MPNDDVRIPNVPLCLEKIKDLLKMLPSKPSECICYEDLKDAKDKAEKAVQYLSLLYGQGADFKSPIQCRVGGMSI